LVLLREFLERAPGYITEVDHEAVGLEFPAAILENP
jgi:hypothetical protein